ncbi:MAG: 50S ribosomal protein L21 [Sumerlaeia bacterium]
MYAVLRQGTHQYRVTPGDTIQVEKISAEKGDTIDLEEVLLISGKDGVELGSPRLSGVTVRAQVLREGRGKKVIVYKFRRRKGFAKKQGHRQSFTELRITGFFKDGEEIEASA